MGKLVNSGVHYNYKSKTFIELERASCCIEGHTQFCTLNHVHNLLNSGGFNKTAISDSGRIY